jgi:hypothetical protein
MRNRKFLELMQGLKAIAAGYRKNGQEERACGVDMAVAVAEAENNNTYRLRDERKKCREEFERERRTGMIPKEALDKWE